MDPLKVAPPQETKLHFLDYWRIIRIRKTVILAVFLLVVITATVVTFVLPELFSSTARIKVERDQPDIDRIGGGPTISGIYDPYFIQTEFEVLQSEVILGNVLTTPLIRSQRKGGDVSLIDWWSEKYKVNLSGQEAMKILKQNMVLRPVRNTSLIEIQVYNDDPKEASLIANAIAQTYQEHRKKERRDRSQAGIEALKASLQEQEAKIREAQSNVDFLRVQLQVPDAMAAADAPNATLISHESLQRLEALRIESEAEYVRQRTMLDKLKGLQVDELAQAIPTTGVPDTLLNELLGQLTMAEQRLISLQKEYGEKHSEVTKVAAQVDDLKSRIKDRVNGALLGLGAKVESQGQMLADLSNSVVKATQTDVEKAAQSQPYFQAKRYLDSQERFRQVLVVKILSEKTDINLPRESMVEIVDPAQPGMRPVKPNKTLNITLGIIIGLVVGVGLAFFIEYLDTSVKTIDDVERSLGSAVLGVIPQNVGILLEEGAESPHAEAYRVLRTNLLFSRKDDKLNTVAIVSAGAGEGKSTTVFNLATVFAQSGQRVLMVDSDLRRPTLHKMLRVTNSIGLTNYLLKQNSLEDVIQTTNLPTLDFMPSGKLPSSSLGILSSSQMRDLITELKQHYDFVFFDSPPVMGVSDASILASEVDMTLQVIQYRRYPQPMNIRAKQLIEKVGGNLVGIVLNNINMSQDESYYYYSGYYHDYYSRNDDQEPVAPADGGSGAKSV